MREPGWTPRNDRRPVDLAAFVHRGEGEPLPAIVKDLTEQGCRLTAEETLRIGERVKIEIPRLGFLDAQIRWALGGEAGVLFSAD
ncbi:MAG TPA: PilZ domain-containing protein [Sphingomicrobium sp.]